MSGNNQNIFQVNRRNRGAVSSEAGNRQVITYSADRLYADSCYTERLLLGEIPCPAFAAGTNCRLCRYNSCAAVCAGDLTF